MKRKLIAIALTAALSLSAALSLTACGDKKSDSSDGAETNTSITIAIPNDATNGGRALLLLDDLGYIKLKDNANITACPLISLILAS